MLRPRQPASQIVSLPSYRRVLWAALLIKGAMFLVEVATSMQSGLLSLLADSIDFAGDALNHGVSLAALAWALAWRAGLQVLRQARAELSGETPNSHAHEHQR